MNVVALLTIRNEELYLERCLDHLISQGIKVFLTDNGSTDRSLDIAKKFLGRGVIRIDHLPYQGNFEWLKVLRNKERAAGAIEADWFIHHDADEIREAPAPYTSLLEGIQHADRKGYNAIDFDEFVFLPVNDRDDHESGDYVDQMKYYYFFRPQEFHRINAWKRTSKPLCLTCSGGHRVEFKNRKVFPVKFTLRHYIALSREHAIKKYSVSRVYSPFETDVLGWHGPRAGFLPKNLRLPSPDRLKIVGSGGHWDRSEPWTSHEFLGGVPL